MRLSVDHDHRTGQVHGLMYWCQDCCRANNAEFEARFPGRGKQQLHEWWKKYGYRYPNSARCRKNSLMRNYGLTIDQYEKMVADQGGRCASCQRPETYKRKGELMRLSVDHDHRTGQVRGLLCHACNRGIGLFGDNMDLLLQAATYLRKHGSFPQWVREA